MSELLNKAKHLFSEAEIPSSHLDAEVLLAYVLGVDRSWLVAHGDEELGSEQVKKFESFVARRLNREPIAYITGRKEFYGREFSVTPDVLIPRPETEDLVELTMTRLRSQVSGLRSRILDVGCGSGCVGITLKCELPELDVTLADISPAALTIARQNARSLNATVNFASSNLLKKYVTAKIQNPKSKIYFDVIVANLPYVDHAWKRSPETDHEPALALFAEDNGLELIKRLIEQSRTVLTENGLLLLEADPCQHGDIITYGKKYGFTHISSRNYALALQKIV